MAELEGLAALEAALAAKLAQLEGVGDEAMADNAQHLAGESARRAPIEIGDLRSAHAVRKLGAGAYEVGVYGLGIYPLVQHERLDFQHPRGGGPKFLESAFAENIDRYVRHVASKLKGAL